MLFGVVECYFYVEKCFCSKSKDCPTIGEADEDEIYDVIKVCILSECCV